MSGSWKGNKSNPVPNSERESIVLSEKKKGDNRAEHVRRDQDSQKNLTIGLYDIDETIFSYLEKMQLQVVDNGNLIKVPYFFGSPDKWVSARKYGYIRDNQGKIIFPAMILKRSTTETDPGLKFFHRYLNVPVMRKYSEKNRYTQFASLSGKNTQVHEVFNMVMPSHMIIKYDFIIWTESIEQMNKLVETFQFNTRDYWGSPKGFRFRTQIENFQHNTAISENDDRIVSTEFSLNTHGYILPENMVTLEGSKQTTKRFLTPKKMVIGTEVVSTNFDFNTLNNDREKWKNSLYPNLDKDDVIPPPPISMSDTGAEDLGIATSIHNTLKSVTSSPPVYPINVDSADTTPYLRVTSAPTSSTPEDNPSESSIAFDEKYFYIYSEGIWRRVPLALFS